MNIDRIREYVNHIRQDCDAIDVELSNTDPVPEPPSGNKVYVKPGDDLQAAFDSLNDTGGIILAEPGEYLTSIKLKPRNDNHKIIVFTSNTNYLPDEEVRIGMDYLESLAILRSDDGFESPFTALRGSGGVSFIGCGFGPQKNDRTVVSLGDDEITLVEELPTDIMFDRVLFYGDPELGQHRGIMASADRVSILNCSFNNFHEEGRDSQCIAAWNGGRNITIDNCYLEGGAENVMFGGAKAMSVDMIPQDIRIVRNLFSKPLAWKDLAHEPSIKCLLEIKNVQRLHIEGNVFDGCWARDWPSGVAVVFKVSPNGSQYTECQDVTFINNVIRNCGSVFSVVGSRDSGEPSGRMRNLTIENNLAYNIDSSPDYAGDGKNIPNANPPLGMYVKHNTVEGNNHSFLYWWWDELEEVGEDLVMTDNCFEHGAYGISGPDTSGVAALDKGWPNSYNVTSNALRKHPDRTVKLPIGNSVIERPDYDASFDPYHEIIPDSVVANVVTTDGKMIGADIDAISEALSRTEGI
jgi:hypothetical protein